MNDSILGRMNRKMVRINKRMVSATGMMIRTGNAWMGWGGAG
jgi:hypothetical protein